MRARFFADTLFTLEILNGPSSYSARNIYFYRYVQIKSTKLCKLLWPDLAIEVDQYQGRENNVRGYWKIVAILKNTHKVFEFTEFIEHIKVKISKKYKFENKYNYNQKLL